MELQVLATQSSGRDGSFSFPVSSRLIRQGSNYKVAAQHPKFVSAMTSNLGPLAAAGSEPGECDLSLSPVISSMHVLRLLLDWGKDPADLDAHLQESTQ